jgi:type VI secretion system secreted protein VgrG
MATAAEVKISIDGKKLESFLSLSVRQDIFLHNTFELVCRIDTFDRFSVAGESFIVEKAQDLIGKKIKIEMNTLGKNSSSVKNSTLFKGLILEVRGTKFQDAFSGAIRFRGAGMDIQLDGDHHCRSFENKSMNDIVKEVNRAYAANLFDKTAVAARYSELIPYVVQYNETNFQFLQRLAKTYGEWFLVTGDNQFYFGDPPETKSNLMHGKDLHEFSFSMRLNPAKFSFSNYDSYKEEGIEKNGSSVQPKTDSYLKNTLSGSDEVYAQEEKFFFNMPVTKDKSDKELEAAVKTEKKSRVAGMNLATGSSDNCELSLGGTVKIEGYVDNGKSSKTINFGEYRIISLYHSLDEGGNYLNHFEAVPVAIEIPPHSNPHLFPICETQSAKVTDTNDPEEMGRVRVRFYWQSSKEQTPWTRIVTPYAGKNKGFFFIPEVGEEVLVAFENQNAEKPYIVGAHYNGKNKPDDWKGDKNYKKAIRTKSGHTIEFNDENGKEEIIIYDKDKINTVTLSSHGKEMTISCQGDLKIDAENIEITARKDYKLDVKGKTSMDSMKETEINAMSTCKIHSNKDIEIEAMANLKAKANAKTDVSGAQLTAKGSATAEFSAGGQTVVKGAIVQIN